MTTVLEHTPRFCTIPERDLKALTRELARAKKHFAIASTAAVLSCYEAGRDGFWLHCFLEHRDVQSRIVDSSSIEVYRRRRRTKTDRLDARRLVTMLLRADAGEQHVWSVVKVPTVTDEVRRQARRELLFARRDRGRHTNRIKGLLAAQGVPLARLTDFPSRLLNARRWNSEPLPALLHERLQPEWDTVQQYTLRIRALKKRATRHAQTLDDPAIAQWYRTRFGTGSGRVRKIGIIKSTLLDPDQQLRARELVPQLRVLMLQAGDLARRRARPGPPPLR